MSDLQKFLQSNKKEIHQLLNKMWKTIEQINIRFEDKIPDGDLENSHGNYIEIDDGWEESLYANPTITYPFGEIGYSLDGLYCAFALCIQPLTNDILEQIVNFSQKSAEIKIELYGADDCFTTYFNSKNEFDLTEMEEDIINSDESIIQLEISVSTLPSDELYEQFLELILEIFEYLSKEELLANLDAITFVKEDIDE